MLCSNSSSAASSGRPPSSRRSIAAWSRPKVSSNVADRDGSPPSASTLLLVPIRAPGRAAARHPTADHAVGHRYVELLAGPDPLDRADDRPVLVCADGVPALEGPPWAERLKLERPPVELLPRQ